MLEQLRQLGWSDYEAKAYLTLLQCSPATGYRIGKQSGVPVAKIYQTLARLLERGAVRQAPAVEGEATLYVPVAPDEVMAGLHARHARMIEELSQKLTALFVTPQARPDFAWLTGRAPVLGRANALLNSARKSVALALPAGWESGFQATLADARARRVRLDRVTLAPEGGASLLVIVVDGVEALLGTLGASTDDSAAEALVAHAPLLVRLCTDYVRLRRAVALTPEAVTRLQRQDDWLDWEEAKQRRLLQHTAARIDLLGGAPN